MAEGMIFGNYLLTEEQFLPIFENWYMQKKEAFKKDLELKIIEPIKEMVMIDTVNNRVQTAHGSAIRQKGKYDAAKIYAQWEEISANYFGNGAVTLIGAIGFDGKGYQWTNNLSEKDVVNKSGINVRSSALKRLQQKVEDSKAIMAAADIQDQLNQHYNNMLNQLGSYTLGRFEARLMHELLEARQSALNNANFHFTDNTYGQIVFGSQRNAAGKQLDAYMNHIGNYHNELFAMMSTGTINGSALQNSTVSLDNDFPGIFADPFTVQPWLVDSLNSASWLTGGDIVVVGSDGAVIYNIQLKTTGKGKTFELAVSSLYSFANEMLELIEKPDDLAKLMFKRLRTTSANDVQGGERFLTQSAKDMILKNLGVQEKKPIPVRITVH